MLTIPEVGSEMAEGWSILGSVGGWNLVLEGRSLIVSPVVSVTATPQVDVSVFVHGGDTQPPFTSIPVTDLITPEFATQLSGQGLEVPEEALRELSTILISSHTAAPTEWSVEVSEKVQQARDTLLDALRRHLLTNDLDAPMILLAAVAAHGLSGDPVWLLIVGPPSSAKTVLMSILNGLHGIFPLSDLTEKTLASGLEEKGGKDPSLLMRLTTEILVFKDFTTVLSMHGDRRAEVLAQLREIYDGSYVKIWGTGKEMRWKGRLGFIAGVTDAIEKHHAVMASLGPRFLIVRPRLADRIAVATRALQNAAAGDRGVQDEFAALVVNLMATLPSIEPAVSGEYFQELAQLADFVTRCRTGVERDPSGRELLYAPEPEMPARFVRQLLSLARGCALINGRDHVAEEDVRVVVRVGLDSLPSVRRAVFTQLVGCDARLTVRGLTQALPRYSHNYLRRVLEDLQALEIVRAEGQGQGKTKYYFLCDEWADNVRRFIQMVDGDPL